MEQLRIIRQTCDDLECANGKLRAEWAKDKALMKSVFDKLMGTANYADSLEREWIHMEGLLERQEPQIIAFRQELDRLKAEILRLKEENSASDGSGTKGTTGNVQRQLRRLEKSQVIMQRRLLLANARNEDLIRQNNELARKVQLAKLEQKAEEELAKAKEEIEWYEGKTIHQQEKIFELGRLLGFSQAANRDLREAHRIEMERLQEQFSAQLESLNEAHERKITETEETAFAFHHSKLQEWDEREKWLLGNAKRQADLHAEERVHETVMARQEACMRKLGAESLEKERKWRNQLNELKQQNDELNSQLAELQDFINEQVEEGVAKRLDIERAAERPEIIKELEGRIADLQAQFEQEREDHREQMKAAIAQGWQLSSDTKAQELMEEIDQLEETLQQAEDDRDELFNELEQCRQSAEDKAKEAEEQKEEIKDLKMELAQLCRAHGFLRDSHDALRKAHDSVIDAQEAAMEANAKLQSDLQTARNQVDELVDQNEELEEDLQSLRIARNEADKMHKYLLEAERKKNRELVTIVNTARNSSYNLSPIREEEAEEESSEESGSKSPQVRDYLMLGLNHKLTDSEPTSPPLSHLELHQVVFPSPSAPPAVDPKRTCRGTSSQQCATPPSPKMEHQTVSNQMHVFHLSRLRSARTDFPLWLLLLRSLLQEILLEQSEGDTQTAFHLVLRGRSKSEGWVYRRNSM
jgi:uncharacterized coiled-coil DUF342 family protein